MALSGSFVGIGGSSSSSSSSSSSNSSTTGERNGFGSGSSWSSYTSVEREIAGLVAKGVVRKVVIPGLMAGGGSGRRAMGDRFRLGGKGGGGGIGGGFEMTTAGGEGLVLVKEWERMVDECKQLSEDIKSKYIHQSTMLETYICIIHHHEPP